MNYSMREIVMLLELAADKKWVDAFYFPFDKISNFKPIMGAYTQVLTCIMNIRISIEERNFEKVEEALIRVEKLKKEFIEIDEVNKLAELILNETNDWNEIEKKFENLETAWKHLIPPTRLGRMIELFQNSTSQIMQSLLTPKSYNIVRVLAKDFTEKQAISILEKLCKDYEVEISEEKLKSKKRAAALASVGSRPSCHKKLKFSQINSEKEKSTNDPEQWNAAFTELLGQ